MKIKIKKDTEKSKEDMKEISENKIEATHLKEPKKRWNKRSQRKPNINWRNYY